MKKAFAVIGANFGDEGKGLMTDYFCSKNKKSLNIRFNGGAQAGHTVVTNDGRRHVFSHIGAGSFSGADTYLSEFFITNPILFMKEYSENFTGNIYISKDSNITLPCDMLINQFAEEARKNNRHGSCGVGIYETVSRSSNENFRIKFGDVISDSELYKKIALINNEYIPERLERLGIENIPDELSKLLSNNIITENFIEDLNNMKKICHISDDSITEKYENVVFEGAQGLMLDCERKDYFPNLTPSNTGMKNVRSILNKFPDTQTEICYVTRSYFTRHGAGKFNTESEILKENYNLYDKTNQPNKYQGNFRYGFFDYQEFLKSIKLDSKYWSSDDFISLCVTHIDETDGKIICPEKEIYPNNIAININADFLYVSDGESQNSVKKIPLE